MKRWPLILMAVIWLGLGVFLSWVNGVGAHAHGHAAGETHAAESSARH
ncbi:MAG: hypothetical protein H5U00_12355 [Clostridia bacterium]|nr:hypothetical protein [Clostridia bacterium]